jgi:hypothetical protein
MSFVIGIEEVQEFEDKTQKICDLAFAYAIRTFSSFNPTVASKKESNAFLAKCHEGFALAQEIIVEEVSRIQARIRQCTMQLKDARRKKNKEEVYQTQTGIIHQQNRELILRKIADAIAWQLFGMQRWNLRRLYLGKQMPYLDSSNIKSVMDAIKQINRKPLSFGLIADITSFIQVGDILAVNRSSESPQIQIIEVKEGKMNAKVMEFLQTFDKIRCPRIPYFFAQEHGKEALKQAIRVTAQQMRAAQVQQFVKTGKGRDPFLDKEILMPEGVFEEKNYDEVLVELIENCKSQGKAYGVVDECLFIGVFDPVIYPAYLADFVNNLLLDSIGKEVKRTPFERSEEAHMITTYEFLENAYPVYDLRLSLTIPLSMPIFLRYLPPKSMLDIIFGKMIVMLYLDYDKWFARSTNYGIVARWATDEETKADGSDKGIFKVLGRTPLFEKKGKIVIMGDGTFVRIIDGIRPDSILEITSQGLDHILAARTETVPDSSGDEQS